MQRFPTKISRNDIELLKISAKEYDETCNNLLERGMDALAEINMKQAEAIRKAYILLEKEVE